MATAPLPTVFPSGEIITTGASEELYLAYYAEHFCEYVGGNIIKMSPVSARHDALVAYFRQLFDAYFELNPVGQVHFQPFVMRLEGTKSFREPDIQIILNENPGELTDTAMIGPADLCIEIVSPESVMCDYGEKFLEYEKAGVREYWIIDPIRERCQFNRLNENGVYAAILPDETGIIDTPLLPRLAFSVPTLWQEELPGIFTVVQAVRAMFETNG
jgi:Uma2 family endonuclease